VSLITGATTAAAAAAAADPRIKSGELERSFGIHLLGNRINQSNKLIWKRGTDE
jgi:hypothetical protein